MNKLISTVVLLLLLAGCGENHGLKEETFLFDEENKGWIVNDPGSFRFMMQDDNGISYAFSLKDSSYYFGKSWGSFLGITTHISYREYHYQNFFSNYGLSFHLSLTAGFPPYGDVLYIDLGDIAFAYDFNFETISRINVYNSNKSLIMTDEGYEVDEEILSSVEILNNLEVGGRVYTGVLHFKLEDFTGELYRHSVREIFIARERGLLKYVLNSGLEVIRIGSSAKKSAHLHRFTSALAS